MPRPFVLREVVGEPREEQISGARIFVRDFLGGSVSPF